MATRRLLILGASGLVGSYTFNYFVNKDDYKVLGTYYKHSADNLIHLDKLNKQELHNIFLEFCPDIVIDSSYIANVDKCEIDENCSIVNIDGTQNVMNECNEMNSLLIFLSSDYVFDGEKGPYAEDDKPNPINKYGIQKLKSEIMIRDCLKEYLIVRVATVYGFKDGSKNTLQILKNASEKGENLKYVNDQWVTPTYAGNIPEGIELLIKNESSGVWHISSGQFLNRFEFAEKLKKKFNIDVNITPQSTHEVLDVAKRPKKAGLKIEKIKVYGFNPVIL